MPEGGNSRIASVLSGSLSGAFVSLSIQPLDVVRTRMQGDAVKGIRRGPFSTAKFIYNEGGVRSLWRGAGAAVIRLTVGAGLHFFFLDEMRDICAHFTGTTERTTAQNAVIGGASRALVTSIMCPVTVIKTRMEYSNSAYKSTANAFLTIARKEGMKGLFSGMVPTILTNAPFSGLHYMFYRELQTLTQDVDMPTVGKNFVCSSLSAMGATLLTHPTDVIRTRTQLGMAGTGTWKIFQTFRTIVATQGVQGFFIGVAPRITKRALQTAMLWTLYEEVAPRLKASIAERTKKIS